ncbi:uroporphyrinogen-III C-methyltransferase [Flavobacterium cauense R2A-7]|uniref:uroporphyrinogen-III C-methyltransferase n=1 Tax=Flavobacterium cauense R2A-7 TaxID=1341154 RepID=V6RXB0_9FLAO|nr:uroporphyrinogen-III C-methyltransferase [Flavobacterium cauense]ESU19113.1 uroporphyrinogen-III C-methyltransferase [Flavobacterium cauense R2A-7]KGO82258.1 siroheme synthase [Flavobacterium cauense R2A-7]TWI15215.1 uroporphyrin-III C-methyltransferase/precorrin-2 dehydrogenase/sirohydrochlorin ferrochelatase [Flavobacterium cauense R2A-7]
MNIENRGKVILAGAGPGDPDLISVKALKYLQTADVVLTDRLVSPEMIVNHARKEALVLYVGKQCSKGIHTPQGDINDLMVEFAQQNKLVLRLKGGDASLFSNILDELEVLKENEIPYEIIPGISAAFGAAAYTGIPLTAREHARGVRFLTLFDLSSIIPSQWTDWAKTEDTLVFYMSGQRLHALTNYLISSGIDSNKGIAVVQQATTPFQKTSVFSFEDLKTKQLPKFEYVPTLIIIGNVVNLHADYAWFEEESNTKSYFDNHIINLQHAG